MYYIPDKPTGECDDQAVLSFHGNVGDEVCGTPGRVIHCRVKRRRAYVVFWWEADVAPKLETGQLLRMKHPEARFVVEVTADDEIVCRAPKQAGQRIRMADLAAVYVETNDSGPWRDDVWWLLNDITGQTQVAFPQLATGEETVLERLRLLPGFAVRGMNSGENARFMCWPTPVP